MHTLPPLFARTTQLMSGDRMLRQVRDTQTALGRARRQISTGERYDHPSDAPAQASAILMLEQQLDLRAQDQRNLQHARGALDLLDSTLGEADDSLLEARTIASSQIGVGSNADTRQNESQVIQEKINALMDMGNRQYQDIPLFGGRGGEQGDGPVFESFLGGIRYTGSRESLRTDSGNARHPFTIDGSEAFGALSARVASEVDLDPGASASTALDGVAGAGSLGVRLGEVRLTVDGTKADVDLSTADTLGDVAVRVNKAMSNLDPAAGNLAVGGEGFSLTANAGHTITLADRGAGKTAADLGLDLTAGSATVAGADLNPELTPLTRLSDLGPAVDWASGLRLTQGKQTKVADFSSSQTIQDIQNEVESLNLGLRLEINEAGNGLNLISEVSGLALSGGENGGTTAQDLGLRTLGADTPLGEFRQGRGIEKTAGEPEIEVQLHDNTTFAVNLDGVSTVGQMVSEMESRAAAAGVGGSFDVGMVAVGNGLTFTDNTSGGAAFAIRNVGTSTAGDQLGIAGDAGAGNTLTSGDQARVRVEGAFTHLIELRAALETNDSSGITLAGSRVEEDLDRLVQARAGVGVEARQVDQEQQRSEDRRISENSMLSRMRDTDMASTITRFMQMQQQLRASLNVGAQTMRMSLLDYLR